MRTVIQNMRRMKADPQDITARGELAWASSVAELGILKLGRRTDFQNHMIEHQLGAYTNCGHGAGLAVLHPVVYRHICKEAPRQFARFARELFGIGTEAAGEDGEKRAAEKGVEALADFIREMGLPTSFRALGIKDSTKFREIAESVKLMPGCVHHFSAEEIYRILLACM